MAQDQQLVNISGRSSGWTQLTNADVTGNITFQVQEGEVETPEGLHTCADTMANRVEPYTATYREDELRKWVRLSEPKEWRIWQGS